MSVDAVVSDHFSTTQTPQQMGDHHRLLPSPYRHQLGDDNETNKWRDSPDGDEKGGGVQLSVGCPGKICGRNCSAGNNGKNMAGANKSV